MRVSRQGSLTMAGRVAKTCTCASSDDTLVYNSSAAVAESVSGSGYSGTLVTNVTYSVLETFASCNTAVVRWQSDSLSANATNV